MKQLSDLRLSSGEILQDRPASQQSTPDSAQLRVVVSPADPVLHGGSGSLSSIRSFVRHVALWFRSVCFEDQWCVAVRPRIGGPEAFNLKDFYTLKPSPDRF